MTNDQPHTALTHLVDFFLDENKPRDVQALASKVKLNSKDEVAMQALILEALRLDPAFSGVFRQAARDEVVDGQKIAAGTRIFVNIAKANLDVSTRDPCLNFFVYIC